MLNSDFQPKDDNWSLLPCSIVPFSPSCPGTCHSWFIFLFFIILHVIVSWNKFHNMWQRSSTIRTIWPLYKHLLCKIQDWMEWAEWQADPRTLKLVFAFVFSEIVRNFDNSAVRSVIEVLTIAAADNNAFSYVSWLLSSNAQHFTWQQCLQRLNTGQHFTWRVSSDAQQLTTAPEAVKHRAALHMTCAFWCTTL